MAKEEPSVEEVYTKLSKQFSLPPFEELDMECELSIIDLKDVKEKYFLRAIARKIEDRLSFFQDIFAEILNPDLGSVGSLYESHFFDDHEKEVLFVPFQKLMIAQRNLLEAHTLLDNKNYANVIQEIWSQYPSFKKEVLALTKKMKKAGRYSSKVISKRI